MPKTDPILEQLTNSDYKYGFVTNIESEKAPKGLNEDTVRFISAKKEEPAFLLEWRLKAYALWKKMKEPEWARVYYPEIDFQDIYYYAAPKDNFEDDEEYQKELNLLHYEQSSTF